MYLVSKEFRFEAAHRLPHLPEGHKCRNLHGHSYRFTVTVEGELDERGFVADYADMAEAMAPLVDALDHSFIGNAEDPVYRFCAAEGLKVYNLECPSTAEHIASLIGFYAKHAMPSISLQEVAVYETPTTVARWSP